MKVTVLVGVCTTPPQGGEALEPQQERERVVHLGHHLGVDRSRLPGHLEIQDCTVSVAEVIPRGADELHVVGFLDQC